MTLFDVKTAPPFITVTRDPRPHESSKRNQFRDNRDGIADHQAEHRNIDISCARKQQNANVFVAALRSEMNTRCDVPSAWFIISFFEFRVEKERSNGKKFVKLSIRFKRLHYLRNACTSVWKYKVSVPEYSDEIKAARKERRSKFAFHFLLSSRDTHCTVLIQVKSKSGRMAARKRSIVAQHSCRVWMVKCDVFIYS